MKIIHTFRDFRAWRAALPQNTLAPFVPTMGALHEGHASLVRQARQIAGSAGSVLASIFVNPTQFGPHEDFAKYPRTLEADAALLQSAGADAVFVPTVNEIYPNISATSTEPAAGMTSIDPGPLSTILEGAIRPGHFRGVCLVVAKLLNITQPTHLLLGQKDFQQQAILRQMCLDLNMPLEVITCPTLREPDGLAMSSRNRYLSAEERQRAIALFEALTWAKDTFNSGERNAKILDQGMEQRLTHRHLLPQYALTCHRDTLQPIRETPTAQITAPAVLLIAAKLGTTRLIDNMLV